MNRPGGDDPFNADRRGRFLSREQDFMQSFTCALAGKCDLDAATTRQGVTTAYPGKERSMPIDRDEKINLGRLSPGPRSARENGNKLEAKRD